MQLFYVPGTCSLTPHIVINEAGLAVETVKVDRTTKLTATGEDYLQINTKGHVPALRIDDGRILTETAVIAQYLADQNPAAGLLPPLGSFERYQAQSLLNFIATEVHRSYYRLFQPTITPEGRAFELQNLTRRYDWLAGTLGGAPYLTGEQFTVPDAYLYNVTRWADRVKVDLSPWPSIVAFQRRVAARPKVHQTLFAEGLAS